MQHLVDPASGAPLALTAAQGDDEEAQSGILVAGEHRYPIQDGIPSFVREEVLDLQTVRSFSQKWENHKYYRNHTGEFYTQWYLDRYGFYELANLEAFLDGRRFILDAGTGSGRDAATFARHSKAMVFGADTAMTALQVATKEVTAPNVAFVHADITQLPFRDEFFDFINCDQVIHHTEDPPRTLDCLRRKLAPGGEICCYVYRKKAVIREFVDDYLRERIKHLPAEEALRASRAITALGRSLAKLSAEIEVEEDIPLLGIKKGRLDVQRFVHWNVMKCFWNEDFDFHTNNVINFDWYHPEFCHRYEPEEFRSWFAKGWEIESFDVQDAGLSCRARKV